MAQDFLTPKRDQIIFKHIKYYFYISSCETLINTFKAYLWSTYDGVLPRTPISET